MEGNEKMKLKHFMIMVIAAGCILIHPVQAVQISVEPLHIDILKGENFTVDITIDPEGSEIFGAQYELYFNNTLLNATLQTKGAFLSQDGESTTEYENEINNIIGRIKYGESRAGVDYGVANPGILATITFQTIAEQGVSGLRLENVKLSDPVSGSISTEVNNATVEIAQPSTSFLIHGYVSYENGSECDNPTVNITNLNTSKEWTVKTNETSNYYQIMLSSTDINTSETLQFNAASPDKSQWNVTEYAVTRAEVDAGGFGCNITLEYRPGDVNGDGRITPADAAIALQMAVRGAYSKMADVSGDNSVTSLDALMILQEVDENIIFRR
jgi:hypothetical protein